MPRHLARPASARYTARFLWRRAHVAYAAAGLPSVSQRTKSRGVLAGDGRPCGGTTSAIQTELSPATVLFTNEQTGTAGAGTLHTQPTRTWAHGHAWKLPPCESDQTQSRTIGCVDTCTTIL